MNIILNKRNDSNRVMQQLVLSISKKVLFRAKNIWEEKADKLFLWCTHSIIPLKLHIDRNKPG